jgi:uncharacterized protein (DUF58 family)
MPVGERQPFPLVPRRRLVGLPFGDLPTRRRGHGSDVIGSRPYEIGDPVSTIDWFTSARLSAAHGSDEFVIRDRASDEAPRVALVCDRRPAMGIYPRSLPWLSKPRALLETATAIAISAAAARSDLAAIDFAETSLRGGGEPYWLPPGRRDRPWLVAERQGAQTPFDAAEDNVEEALRFLGRMRSDFPPGSFVFVLSDFIAPVSPEAWVETVAYGWDVVAVVIQDPVWEQSFPPVGSVLVPFVEPGDGATGRTRLVRLTRREADGLRRRNEERLARMLGEQAALGVDSVLVESSDPDEIDRAFVVWAEARRRTRWAR